MDLAGAARTRSPARAASAACRRRFPARAPARAGCPAARPRVNPDHPDADEADGPAIQFGDEDRLRALFGAGDLVLPVDQAVLRPPGPGSRRAAVRDRSWPSCRRAWRRSGRRRAHRPGARSANRTWNSWRGARRRERRRAFDKGRRSGQAYTHDAAPVRSRFDYSRHCDLGGLARIHPRASNPPQGGFRVSWARLPVYSTQEFP